MRVPGPSRTYKAKLGNGSGTILELRFHQLRIISLNDPRHWNQALEFSNNPDQMFPPQADAEWCNRQRQYIPVTPGYKWEYFDVVDKTWKAYNEHIQCGIETLYDMGGEHFLYRPGAPPRRACPCTCLAMIHNLLPWIHEIYLWVMFGFSTSSTIPPRDKSSLRN